MVHGGWRVKLGSAGRAQRTCTARAQHVYRAVARGPNAARRSAPPFARARFRDSSASPVG
eukprot:263616-Prymnesium_polylepis.1